MEVSLTVVQKGLGVAELTGMADDEMNRGGGTILGNGLSY